MSAEQTPQGDAPSPTGAGTDLAKKRGMGLLFPAVIVGLVVGGLALVVRSSTKGGVYDMTLGQLLAAPAEYVGKDVRVNGSVLAGSFQDASDASGVHVLFTIGDASGQTLEVHYRQLLPDAFQEGRQVIVQGKMVSEKAVECNRLTVKCPSKYQDENSTGKNAAEYYQNKGPAGEAAPTKLEP